MRGANERAAGTGVSPLPGLAVAVAVLIYVVALLYAEDQNLVLGLVAAGLIAAVAAARFGALERARRSFEGRETLLHAVVVVGILAATAFFYNEHFVLLLLATVMVYIVAALGLNMQFGYVGVLNFAGAAFFGVGCYTAAVLTVSTPLPHLLAIPIGGAMAALVGSLLILPVLRTRGHYAAVVTIAFSLLFKTFIEVNPALGGPQGLMVEGMSLVGWEFNEGIDLGAGAEAAFYVNYVLLALVLLVLAFAFVRRVERSWIGLNLDAVRLDETASACFGLNITRWKITAFMLGNFLTGMAGAVYGMMIGFIAPNNFTFGDSLVFVSIVLLGGIGNPWGVALASVIVVVLPEKLQVLQEYRFLLYGSLVILILLFRPSGLLPRPLRTYFPAWRLR